MTSSLRPLLVLVTAALLLLIGAAAAGAATIKVTSTLDGGPGDSGCNLRDAVSAANTNTPVGGCPGDSAGADTILLEGGKTYRIERHQSFENANAKGDFDIAGPVTIRATGEGLATVDANNLASAGGPVDADRVFEVLFEAGAVVLERLRITGGVVTVPPVGIFVGGGGVFSSSDLTVRDSEIVGNAVSGNAYLAGGGVFVETVLGRLTIERSTVAENTVRSENGGLSQRGVGGGVAAFNGAQDLTIVNSTVSGNAVLKPNGNAITFGGGIYAGNQFKGAPTTLRNVTVTRNSAENSGGAELATATLGGTIVAGNTTLLPASTECTVRTAGSSLGGNLIGAAATATGCDFANAGDRYGTPAAPVPPNLGPLAANGGPTRTMAPNTGSPAIDIGGTCPDTDQRGFFRAAAAPCDSGAVELGASPTAPGGAAGKARLKRAGKLKLTGRPRGRLTLRSGILATCPAGGPVCRGRIKAKPKVLPRRGSGMPRSYGSAPISLKPGKSRLLVVKLTPGASALARAQGKLRLAVSAWLKPAGGTKVSLARSGAPKPPG